MRLNRYKLGDLIKQRREKYDGNENLPIRGVSREGFIDIKVQGADISLYNTFYLNDFVFNPARMEINSIALNKEYNKAICSSLYEVFFVNRQDILLPEYLNLYIKRSEFARRCEFIGLGSAREYCRVADISNIDIDLPPISIQQKYVNIYNSMLANQRAYERGLDDLKLTCFAIADQFKYTEKKMCVGELLEEVDERNTDGVCKSAHGINITKQFMPSIASSEDLFKYKLVQNKQFAYSSMQTGRDECIRIALNTGEKVLAVSPAYSVLKRKSNLVIEEYIQLWFSRPESDRRGWFMSDSSIRANLDLRRFFEIEIPIPDLKKQASLVEMYKTYTARREINERLKTQMADICPILLKGSLEEPRNQV